jgi:hypothetical protein
MGSSDFDALTFAQYGSFAIGVKAHCPLKQNLRQWKRRALKPQQRETTARENLPRNVGLLK